MCDGFANKKIKELISEQEEIHYDQYEAEWKASKFTVSDRRVLLAQWTLEAYNQLHEKYGYLIVKAFEQVGLSLNPDGSEDWKLKIRDLPDIEIGDYERPLLSSPSPFAIDQDETGLIFAPRPSVSPVPPRMNLRSATYVTAKEVKNGILDNEDGFEDENDVTTDTSNDSEPDFDDSESDEFDPILGADYDAVDDNMDVD